MAVRTQIEPLSIIVALDECGGFAKNGKIPWIKESFAKEDLKNFKNITTGGICIMGRNTYDDILAMQKNKNPTNILPNRENYVITSRGGETPGAIKASGIREVIHELDENDRREIFILGGYRLFVEALPNVHKIYVTVIPGNYLCDIQFPLNSLGNGNFQIINGRKEGDLKFITYQRVR
jgi:dihydrofolate reductase